MTIEVQSQVFVNTDPQRRCYNGAHKSYTYLWTTWEPLETFTDTIEGMKDRLKFWKELNDYAVSRRGEPARKKFRIIDNATTKPLEL